MLLQHPMTITEISRVVDQPGKDTVQDLQHLIQSLKHTEFKPVIEVATCKKCRFLFGDDKLRKPSKCPKCKATWITEPRIHLIRK
jgi:predicted Zn-ribbon and HTH transcriptional regulator